MPTPQLSLLLFAFLTFAGQGGDAPPSELPALGSAAPDFALSDAHTGAKRKLSEFTVARRPVALFFFCGCPACHVVAAEWATLQRKSVLPPDAATLIVYQGDDAAEARTFVRDTGLDTKHTAFLLDGDLSISDSLYHALPCPRLLAVDRRGSIRYVNPRTDDADAEKNAKQLGVRVLYALQNVDSTKKDGEPTP